jgi:hypothetical protein
MELFRLHYTEVGLTLWPGLRIKPTREQTKFSTR